MWEQLKVALATLKAAPAGWVDGINEGSEQTVQWLWEVLQGDFGETDQSNAQLATGTIISMVPLIDQVCDVRDLIANCKQINKDPNNGWHWFALCLTLLGLFPTLGSLLKGCLKILFGYARHGVPKAMRANAHVWDALSPFVERSIQRLNVHMSSGIVRKTLKTMRITNPYGWLATQVRALSKTITANELLTAFDNLHQTLNELLDYVSRYGNTTTQHKVVQLQREIKAVRERANGIMGRIVRPLQEWLEKLARRLDEEQARTLKTAAPVAQGPRLMHMEKETMDKAKPVWVDKGLVRPQYPGLDEMPANADEMIQKGYPRNIQYEFANFHGNVMPAKYPPGTVLYRIVDPTEKSFASGQWWTSKAEFDAITSKDEWRRKFGVWRIWKSNGEFMTYQVPEGTTLKGWQGISASQEMYGTGYTLEGGGLQILLDPYDLKSEHLQKRWPTHWGYNPYNPGNPRLIGVPVLQHKWPTTSDKDSK